jgi:hypothetical protein
MHGLSRMSRGDPLNLNGVRDNVADFGDIDTFMQSFGTSTVPQGISLRDQAPRVAR